MNTATAYFLMQISALVLCNSRSNAADSDDEYPITEKGCGYRPGLDGRAMDHLIVGGKDVVPHSWPWYVNIEDYGNFICGGTILNSRWIITAANCMKYSDPSRYTVIAGLHKRGDRYTSTVMKVEKIFTHEGFAWKYDDNDIALLYLTKPIPYSWKVQPTCIGTTPPEVGTLCYVVGFGLLKGYSEEYPDNLQEVGLPIISNKICSKWYEEEVSDNMICATNMVGGKDSCDGDSGGPLMCNSGGKWRLQGVVSLGPKRCGAKNSSSQYTKVTAYKQWIAKQMQSMDRKW